jgi:hypothetical protein
MRRPAGGLGGVRAGHRRLHRCERRARPTHHRSEGGGCLGSVTWLESTCRRGGM